MTRVAAAQDELRRLYDDLARFQHWRRRLAGSAHGAGLEMHKRLAPPRAGDANGSLAGAAPGAGTAALHDWLWARLDTTGVARALDVGCGFGATLFSLARSADAAELIGLTLSPYQARVAEREARRVGLASRTSFLARSFDELPDGPFDLVLSIEALFHATDLARTLRAVAERLVPGGRVALVEDMAGGPDVAATGAGRSLLARWSTAALHSADDYRAALESAGLRLVDEVDLTAQVPRRSDAAAIDRSARTLNRLRRLAPLPSARRVLDAFLGGLDLERLYATGQMSYRVMIASGPRGGTP
jgi:SAM-dependent methyltransferase